MCKSRRYLGVEFLRFGGAIYEENTFSQTKLRTRTFISKSLHRYLYTLKSFYVKQYKATRVQHTNSNCIMCIPW